YRLIGLLGLGGVAQVYRAIETSTGRHFALKLLRPELQTEPALNARLLSESEVLVELAHPHIVKGFGLYRMRCDAAVLVMEL
ncbi:protein kinase, partial [Klebsiella pneumoniae]|uniref:protein kinase domain-containing protein n=1 Tax=Klebsiella pneumoniae TaxID=573 RepID=UPI002270A98A